MIRTMHMTRSADSSPAGATLADIGHREIGPQQRLEMVELARLAGQFDGRSVQHFVDQGQCDGVLGGEVSAERAGRHVGDRGDLVDGGAVETLPIAKIDGSVDEGGASPLLLAFPQAEGCLPPEIRHKSDANQRKLRAR